MHQQLNLRKLTAIATALSVVLGATLGTSIALAADEPVASYPSKPVRVIVTFAPGGSSDVVGRLLAQKLGEKFGQQFIVENRTGAAGNVGTDAVAKSTPDGYTLGISTSGPLANNKHLYKDMPFDPEKNLTPVALIGEIPLIIAVNPGVPAKNLKELLELARTKPGTLSVASPGNGTIGHLAWELIKSTVKTDITHVPYKGDVPAMTDVLSGNVQVLSAPITAAIPHVQAGKLRGLAITSKVRFPAMPDVPTAIEQGVNVEATVWSAIVGPAGMPKAYVEKLNTEANRIIASTEGQAKLAQFGSLAGGGSPDRLGSLMRAESVKWKQVIDNAKLKLD